MARPRPRHETLADGTGTSLSTLSHRESGKRRPTLDMLIPLACTHRVALDQRVVPPATDVHPSTYARVYGRGARGRGRTSLPVPVPCVGGE
ncbi:helix-turn-helix domain-containing protein [Streptomyces sp. CA-181903]|uniref:helix-turn-helix domain-containing protein n=1 Tax=Streptomyces sp. CA-181903 TaxID=3240055 RepID=UPI003D901272